MSVLFHSVYERIWEWHPAKQRHQLAPIANAQAERVSSVSESTELVQQPGVELDDARPALGAVVHIRIAKPTAERNTAEPIQSDITCDYMTAKYRLE